MAFSSSKKDAARKMKKELPEEQRQQISEMDGEEETLFGFEENATQGGSLNEGLLFRWMPESTKLLLQLRFERHKEFQDRLRQKKDIWSEIAAEMQLQGDYIVTPDACDLKFRNLLQTYKKNRLKEDSGLQSLIVWEYYDIFSQALKGAEEADESYRGVVPSLLCESVCNNNSVDGEKDIVCEKSNEANGAELAKKRIKIEMDEAPSVPKKMRTRTSKPRWMSSIASALNEQNANGNKETAETGDNLQCTKTTAHEILPCCAKNIRKCSENKQSPPRLLSAHSQTDVMEQNLFAIADKSTTTPSAAHITARVATAGAVGVPRLTDITTPAWLATSELHECRIFGESIGLQLANIRESHTRALLQLRIQELLYKAKTSQL